MEESDMLPLKRVELSLSKFNEVAIPHHLDLLRQHKANILKYSSAGDYGRVRSEQTNARRVVTQLRALMGELESLRRRVRPADRAAFDARARASVDDTLRAIVDYLGMIESSCQEIVENQARHKSETSPLAINRRWAEGVEGPVAGSAVSTDSVGVVAHAEPALLQLQVDDHELSIQEREAVLRGWSELQDEVRALHETWQHLHDTVRAQREPLEVTARRVEVAAVNVQEGRKTLSAAEKLRVGAYGLGGAALGALAGGPAGLIAGAKVGAAAALAGSLLGYAAVTALLKPPVVRAIMPPPPPESEQTKKND